MNLGLVLDAIRGGLGLAELQVETIPHRETVVTLAIDSVRPAIEILLQACDLHHLSAITGDRTTTTDSTDAAFGCQVVLLYHFWHRQGLTLRTVLPPAAPGPPRAPTVSDLIPGAAFQEREVAEMFGVTFDGLDISEPFLLPDDWNDDPPLLDGGSAR
jgi:NADH:ubiquinone oxidoreductase subunit C